jgi:hypothetical protein
MTGDAFNPTHEGWFWFCPVLAVLSGDSIDVRPRSRWLSPVLDVCLAFESARIRLSVLMLPGYEPSYMFKLRAIPNRWDV